MHELSLASAIADTALGVLEREGARRLVSVRVRLGVLSCARREALESVFPLVTRDGPLAGARLEVVADPLVLRCESCGARTETPRPVLRCGACGASAVRVESGRDLVIDSLEVAG